MPGIYRIKIKSKNGGDHGDDFFGMAAIVLGVPLTLILFFFLGFGAPLMVMILIGVMYYLSHLNLAHPFMNKGIKYVLYFFSAFTGIVTLLTLLLTNVVITISVLACFLYLFALTYIFSKSTGTKSLST